MALDGPAFPDRLFGRHVCVCVCDSLSPSACMYAAPTDRQTGCTLPRYVSETLSFSESPCLGFMTRSGAMQASQHHECPAFAAQVVKGEVRSLCPRSVRSRYPCISAVTQPHTYPHKDAQEGSYIHPANPSTRWGPGFLLDARSTPDLRSPSPPLPLCPSILPYVLHPDF